jgi:hypothetical protein
MRQISLGKNQSCSNCPRVKIIPEFYSTAILPFCCRYQYLTLYFSHISFAGVRFNVRLAEPKCLLRLWCGMEFRCFPLYDFWWKRNAANFMSALTNHSVEKWVFCHDVLQCFGSALVSIRIRIQHFRSIRIRIQIQGFDDQKLKKFAAEKN